MHHIDILHNITFKISDLQATKTGTRFPQNCPPFTPSIRTFTFPVILYFHVSKPLERMNVVKLSNFVRSSAQQDIRPRQSRPGPLSPRQLPLAKLLCAQFARVAVAHGRHEHRRRHSAATKWPIRQSHHRTTESHVYGREAGSDNAEG